jgi:hypothetical protein
MFRFSITAIIIYAYFNLNFLSITNTKTISVCDTLDDIKGNENDENNLSKLRRIRALCDAIHSSQVISDKKDLDYIPNFDLTQIESGNF